MSDILVELLVVAGGGGGGTWCGGGGGGGGVRHESAFGVDFDVPYTVTVGNGAPRASANGDGADGEDSAFGSVVATKGGGGGSYVSAGASGNGRPGGSGGGVGWHPGGTPGAGVAGPPRQGYDGGHAASDNSSGGGGGGGEAGHNAAAGAGGQGGDGIEFSQFAAVAGTPAGWFAGGGGAFGVTTRGPASAHGGGGIGSNQTSSQQAADGVAGTGGGGGGGWYHPNNNDGGGGGKGIVIVRYAGLPRSTAGSVTQAGGYTTHVFTSSGSITLASTPLNTAPIANAGPDQTIRSLLPAMATLAGSATDDDQPDPPAALTYLWTVVSSPGGSTVTFTDDTDPGTDVEFDTYGEYVLRLTADDGELTGDDDVTITVEAPTEAKVAQFFTRTASLGTPAAEVAQFFVRTASLTKAATGYLAQFFVRTASAYAPANEAPEVDAGPDQSIPLASPIATLAGSATDDGKPNPPAALTYLWTVTSKPDGASVIFDDATDPTTDALFTRPGVYVLRLTADDSALTGYDEVEITVTQAAPTVDAGDDQTVSPAGVAHLAGLASDDGWPNPPSALAYLWTKQSGPGTAIFDDDEDPTTDVTLSAPGVYVLRLTADDGELSAYDDVEITVAANQAPVVEAGENQATYVGAAIVLAGGAADDGWPNPPSALAYLWTKQSGPGAVVFSAPTALYSLATFDTVGTYILRLTADDSALQGYDTLTVTVVARPDEHAFEPDDDLTGDTVGLTWLELRDAAGGLHVSSKVPLADAPNWYGGYKDGDVIQWGSILRSLSDKNGDYQGADFTWTLRDTLRSWRGLLAADTTRVLLNASCVIRMISDQARRAGALARTIVRGFVRRYQPSSPLTFTFTASDWMTRVLTTTIPQRRLTRLIFSDLPPEAEGKPEPILYGKMSDEGSEFGPVTGMTAAPQDLGSPVTGLAGTPSLTGGSLPAGTDYPARVSAVGDDGVEYALGEAVTVTTPIGTCQLPRATEIPAPRWTGEGEITSGTGGIPGLPGVDGACNAYRYTFATALKTIGGVLRESDPSNWGVTRGDLRINSYTFQQINYDRTAGIERLRLYVFNCTDGSMRGGVPSGFDPLYNPAPPVAVAGETVRLIQIVEVGLTTPAAPIATVYSDVLAPWANTTTYPRGRIVENAFGTRYPGWQDLCWYGDADGTDFVEDANHALIDFAWDPWTPPPGVALAAYRFYYDLPNGDTRCVEISAGSPPGSPAGSPPIERYTLTDELAGTLCDGRTFSYAVVANCADGPTVLSASATATTPARTQLAPILVAWNPLPEALSYYVYRRGAGAAYDRRWTVSATLTYFIDDLLDTGVTLVSGAIGGVGVVPARHVGTEVIGGAVWSTFLLAGHACASVLSAFQEGIRVPESQYGISWLVPGKTGWPFATAYRELGGRWYTLIYVRGAAADDAIDGTRPIACNVWGIETDGDGTGALIERSCLQFVHFLKNFVFGNWLSGAWLTAPAFPTDPAPEAADVLHVIDEASFDAADDVSETRVVGGYVGATLIGAGDELLTAREMVARWSQSCDVDTGFNRRTQFSIWMEDDDPALAAAALEYTQERDIVAGTFAIEDQEQELYNCRPYRYGYKPVDDTWTVETQVEDATSIATLGETRTAESRDLYMVRLPAVADDIGARLLARTAYPPRLVTWQVGLSGLSSELADIVAVTHADGIGVTGWVRHPLRVRSHEVNPEEFTVTFTARDVSYLYEGSPGL